MQSLLKILPGYIFTAASVWLVFAWADETPVMVNENTKVHSLSSHHARHGINKPNKHIPSCVSCHDFSRSQQAANPMQAGRERVEALFGKGKEGPRNLNATTSTEQQPPCMSCHEMDTRWARPRR